MIKPLLAIALFTLLSFTAKSQSENFHNFKVDLSLGYASPANTSNNGSGGISFTTHPHYRLSDEFAVGLRLESALLGYATSTYDAASNYSFSSINIQALSSYCATG